MNIIDTKKVKIKKPHNCWGCTTLFPVNSEMQLVKCSEDGKAYSIYWCITCQSVLTKKFEPEDTFAYGELKDTPEFEESKQCQY